MPRTSNPIGPVGIKVARNLVAIRTRWGMTKAELSRRLTAAGRPMSLDVITKIEAGKRTLDVDDLVGFAVVFEIAPHALLGGDR